MHTSLKLCAEWVIVFKKRHKFHEDELQSRSILFQITSVACSLAFLIICFLYFFLLKPLLFEMSSNLKRQGFEQLHSTKKILEEELSSKDLNTVEQRLSEQGQLNHLQYSLINNSGTLLFSTDGKEALGQITVDRPEIVQAQNEGEGFSEGFSLQSKDRMFFWSAQVQRPDGQFILRVAKSQSEIESQAQEFLFRFLWISTLLMIFTFFVSVYYCQGIANSLLKLRYQVEKFSKGDFSSRISLSSVQSRELVRLSQSISDLAHELNDKIDSAVDQKNERDAIFSSMNEGVLAVYKDETILHMNQSLAGILDLSVGQAKGKSVQEIIRIPELQRFIVSALQNEIPDQVDITVDLKGHEKILQVRSTPLRSANVEHRGIVVVINDITQLRRLERHRSDFVANVSHELRTPLTSIRGFSETLLNPNVKDEDRKRFTEIISRHAQRLGEIIDDLLALASLEREQTQGAIDLQEDDLFLVVNAAVEMVSLKAQKSGVKVNVQSEPNIVLRMNSKLLDQALINLLDNAIKYGGKNSIINLSVINELREVFIEVSDSGPGIAKEHLPHLFERFYRVDKSRSRDMGGTGLGLSIVKHVALAHGGRVEVDSEINRGSRFRIIIPKTTEPN